MKKSIQMGSGLVEYVLATTVIVALVFGVKINDKTLWQELQAAFQTSHNNYSKSISNLDSVDVAKNKARERQ